MIKNQDNVLILNDIRSVENVGAIFRTCDALGINKIYLTGHTPSPVDRFGRKRNDLAKSALGAEEYVPWEEREDVFLLIDELKNKGYFLIGIEQNEKSVDYKEVKIKEKNVFILGAEVTGIPKDILEKCDVIAEIPMKGKKESLNVSVSFGVALFRILNI
jgi:23S rRNA (guanosine2251-2'-O)-methyltransferase